MAVYAKLGGKYVGLEPNTSQVYQNRAQGGLWEELTVARRGQYYDVDFKAAQRPLRLNQQTRGLETGTDHDGWGGQWNVSGDGKALWISDSAGTTTLELEGYAVQVPLLHDTYDFRNPDGSRRVIRAVDQFFALRQQLSGGSDAVQARIQESKDLGFDSWRIWSMGSKRQNTIADLSPSEPGYYEAARRLTENLLAAGITPLWTIFVDAQDVVPGQAAQQAHWMAFRDRIAGLPILWSTGNQYPKNGFNPNAFGDPGFLWSRGSSTADDYLAPNGASAAELHSSRQSVDRDAMDAVASPVFMRGHGSTMVWMTEGMPFEEGGGPSAQDAHRLAWHYREEWALVVFHNRASQSGQLLGPDLRAKAQSWVSALR